MSEAIDECDFCGATFAPLATERKCAVCGAPRAKWDSYRPIIVSDEYVLSREARLYGQDNDVVVAPFVDGSAIVTVDEPAALQEIAINDPSGLLKMVSVTIGSLTFVRRPALVNALSIATLRAVMRDRVLLPKVPLVVWFTNQTNCSLMVDVTVAAAPLGQHWTRFVEAAEKDGG
jgi:hypothetical protein